MLMAEESLIGVRIPGISFEWLTRGGGANLIPIVDAILGVALVLCGIWLVVSIVMWIASKMGLAASHKDSAFFLGGPGNAILAAILVGSLAAAMRYGIRLVDYGVGWRT